MLASSATNAIVFTGLRAITLTPRPVKGTAQQKIITSNHVKQLDTYLSGTLYSPTTVNTAITGSKSAAGGGGLFGLGGDGQLPSLACQEPGLAPRLDGRGITRAALLISFPVNALDQFLRTPAANLDSQWTLQLQHWITDSLISFPVFAAACWAGDLAASRLPARFGKYSETAERPFLISLFCVVFLAPAWFIINQHTDPVTAQPLVFPQARDSGDVYSVPPAVIIALASVCLVPAAIWLGRAASRAGAVPVVLAVAAPAAAWLLYRAAAQAYASQVYYAGPGAGLAHPAAPFSLGFQLAHALQDGLAGQSAGFAVLCFLSRLQTPARHPRRQVTPMPPEEAHP